MSCYFIKNVNLVSYAVHLLIWITCQNNSTFNILDYIYIFIYLLKNLPQSWFALMAVINAPCTCSLYLGSLIYCVGTDSSKLCGVCSSFGPYFWWLQIAFFLRKVTSPSPLLKFAVSWLHVLFQCIQVNIRFTSLHLSGRRSSTISVQHVAMNIRPLVIIVQKGAGKY